MKCIIVCLFLSLSSFPKEGKFNIIPRVYEEPREMRDVLVFPTFLLFNSKVFSFETLLKLEDVRASKEAIQLFFGVSFRYLSQNIWPGSTSKMLSMPRKPSNWGRPTRSAQSTPAHPCAQPHVDHVFFCLIFHLIKSIGFSSYSNLYSSFPLIPVLISFLHHIS